MKHPPRHPITEMLLLGLLTGTMFAGTALARSTDRDQQLDVRAGGLDGPISQNGVTRLTDVIITQGSLRIEAANADVTSGAQRGTNGLSAANLRGQGSAATLVLLNGRRVAAHGLSGSAVDVNQIPFAAIDRVEVLKDGASAIYGTDAIDGPIGSGYDRTHRLLPGSNGLNR